MTWSEPCFLYQHGYMVDGSHVPDCVGIPVKAHLIPQQKIKRTQAFKAGEVDLWDLRLWVPACGGHSKLGGHHGMFDHSRTLKLSRSRIPVGTEELAEELGLSWWLDREYGERNWQMDDGVFV